MGEPVEVGRQGGVQTLRLARPAKLNALTEAMYHALADGLAAGEADPATGAHLFLGQPGCFTAGNDIGDFARQAEGGAGGPRGVMRFLEVLALGSKPLVAAVDGIAVGIGTTLLLQCDMVLASPRAVLRTPFIDLGLVPENAASLLAPRVMGHARAFELLCLGESFSAERALSAGIVNAVVPEGEIEARAMALAARLAAKPREAMRLSRALLRGTPGERLARMREESALFAARLRSDEARAAFAAFLARKPG
jgi:enoyl-CoA hydratase/carnithine racemase